MSKSLPWEKARGDVAHEGEWINFRLLEPDEKRKTDVWVVATKGSPSVVLGWIRWYSPWRCYVWAPVPDTIYESRCLDDIATFTRRQTEARRGQWKGAASGVDPDPPVGA